MLTFDDITPVHNPIIKALKDQFLSADTLTKLAIARQIINARRQTQESDSESIDEIEMLKDYGFLYEFNGRLKYKTGIKSGFLTAPSNDEAVNRARKAFDKAPLSDKVSKQDRNAASERAEFEAMDNLYGKKDITALEKEVDDLNKKITSLYKAGENEMMTLSGRSTSKAVSNQGARDYAELKHKLERYIKNRKGNENARTTNVNLESDSNAPRNENPQSDGAILNDGRANGAESGKTSEPTGGAELPQQGDTGLSEIRPDTVGIPSNSSMDGGDGELGDDSRHSDGTGSGDDVEQGIPDDRQRNSELDATVRETEKLTREQKKQLQTDAENIAFKSGEDNIRATLPFLMTEQQDDIIKIENRFETSHGMMITNGTGTGKTYTALGAIKRFAKKGKQSILIVVPGDKIAADFIESAENLHLKIKALEGITDNGGEGIAITTYANFYQNESLMRRDWDLVVFDEAHKINSNAAGDSTGAQAMMRKITNHPQEIENKVYAWQKNEPYKSRLDDIDKEREEIRENRELSDWQRQRITDLSEQRNEILAEIRAELEKKRAKVLFLSATPFAYEKSISYAEGYLFDYPKSENGGYNSGNGQQNFMMSQFGYSMRTNKLTRPDAGVNGGAMQRQFNEMLKKSGALSGRTLKVDADYSREFIILKDNIGEQIDAALSVLSDSKYRDLNSYIHATSFDYLSRLKLLEAIKSKSIVKRIHMHLALNRKVVVFHNYNVGGGNNPFKLLIGGKVWEAKNYSEKNKIQNQYEKFVNDYPKFVNMKLNDLQSPIETLKSAFGGDVMIYNGKVAKKQILQSAKDFNNDALEKNIILMQTDKGKEGVSLHDTTGKKTRVLINLGLPTKPTDTIQIEGRIYRTGQVTDAIFEYISTGTKYEKRIFADVIATRSSEAENLAMGNEARNLLDAFKNGYLNANSDDPSLEQGKGGKEINKIEEISQFDKAISDYFATQKANKNTKSKGVDYFPTPEPIGMKMVDFANLAAGESALEPSAGHGAIARYMPENTKNTYIEPSTDLQSDLALRTAGNGEIKGGEFEDLYVGNKYNAVIMNPPFGKGGKMAIEHLEKATKHLRDLGRVVALIPDGGMAEKRFKQFLANADENIVLTKTIHLPSIAFERAGTAVNTKIVIVDRIDDKETRESVYETSHDFRSVTDIKELFAKMQHLQSQRYQKIEQDKKTLDSAATPTPLPLKLTESWTLQSYLRGLR